jgi:hypothetical protein
VSYPPVVSPRTARTGCLVDPISSSPCGSSPGAFGAYSSMGLSNCMTATNSPWLVAAGNSPNSSPGNAY